MSPANSPDASMPAAVQNDAPRHAKEPTYFTPVGSDCLVQLDPPLDVPSIVLTLLKPFSPYASQ